MHVRFEVHELRLILDGCLAFIIAHFEAMFAQQIRIELFAVICFPLAQCPLKLHERLPNALLKKLPLAFLVEQGLSTFSGAILKSGRILVLLFELR